MYAEEKAALLLMTLDSQDAENVLERLKPEQGNRLRAEIQRLERQPEAQEQLEEVLREFNEFLQRMDTGNGNGTDREPADVDYQVSQAPANESAPNEPTNSSSQADAAVQDGVSAELARLDAETLSLGLLGESPRIVAIVLDALRVNQAGEVLKRLPALTREEVSVQLGRSTPVDPEILQCIADAVVRKCQRTEEMPPPPSEQERLKKMADILRLLPKPDRLAVIAALDQQDSAVAAGVKDFLYQFDDILRIEDRSMQKLLGEVNTKSLAAALQGADQEIKDKVLNNLSKRARETLGEEMEFLGTVPATQIDEARKTIVDMIQRLDQAGELVMKE